MRLFSGSNFSSLGREHAPYEKKQNGTAKTHVSLNKLALAAAVQLSRQRADLDDDILDDMMEAWLAACRKKGLRLTRKPSDYREELRGSIEGAMRKDWFHSLADKWTRWTRDPAFPKEPTEQVLFAIRKHCEAEGTEDFFIGCRDAGLVAGTDHMTAWRILGRLTKAGLIQFVRKYKGRKANDYRLVEQTATP